MRHLAPTTWPRLTAFVSAIFASALLGCPGSLDDPDRFRLDAGTTGNTLYECPSASLKVKDEILIKKCGNAGCHDDATKAGQLDLASENADDRLIGIASTCQGKELLSADAGGFLFEKLHPSPGCGGAQMPLAGTPLTATEEQCLVEWANHVLAGGAE